MTPHFIKRVIADDHRLVYERDELASSQRVVSESTCYIMTRVMNDAWQELMDEQGSHVIGHWAGYAGSHHGLHDAWAVAYSSDFTIGVWIGAERGEVKVAQDSKAARQLVAKLWQQVYMAAGDKVVLGKAWETPADVGFIRVPVKGRQAHRFIPTSLINTHAL